MKQQIKNTLIILTAFLVFWVGAGVTILNFCCSGCVAELLSNKETTSCCAVSHTDTSDESKSCCPSGNTDTSILDGYVFSQKECMSLDRVSAEINHTEVRTTIPNFNLIYTISDVSLFVPPLQIDTKTTESYTATSSLFGTPRDYLSFIRILII